MQLEISKDTDHEHNKALTLARNKTFKLFFARIGSGNEN